MRRIKNTFASQLPGTSRDFWKKTTTNKIWFLFLYLRVELKATSVDEDDLRGRGTVDTSFYRVSVRVLVLKCRRTRLNSEVIPESKFRRFGEEKRNPRHYE